MRLSILLPIIFLAGCATTEYSQREGSFWGSGYYDTKIQEGVYKVGYTGNASTSGDAAEGLALLRAADVALQNGYNYFVVDDRAKRTNVSSSYTPGMPYTYKGNTFFTSGYSSASYTPDIELTIRCYAKKPLDARGVVYDANEVKANLGDKYSKKKDDSAKKGKKATDTSEKSTSSDELAAAPASSAPTPAPIDESAISAEDRLAADQAFDAALT